MPRNQHDPIFFTTPSGRMQNRRMHYGGGGGGSTYYEEANRLYGVQADTADFMLGLGKTYLPDAVKQYQGATQRYFDPSYEAEQAGKAGLTAQQAIDQNNATMRRDMARYGINPASGKWSSMERTAGMQGAALKAGAINQARSNVQDKQFGVAKDFYSNLVGMPSDAAATAGSAASGFASMGANKEAAANQEAAGWGQALGLGYSIYNFKDGGPVQGKYGVKMAMGGLLPKGGLFTANNYTPPPQPTPQPTGGAGAGVVQGVSTAKKMKDAASGAASDKIMGGAAKGLGTLADVTGNTALAETALGAAGAGAEQAGMLVAQNAGIEGATAATAEALGAGTAAAGEAAAAASPALSAISTAIPWLGAAVAVGSMLDLFADGGAVKRKDMTAGGKVNGKGTETSDDVPAWLSDGEYVLNAEAVKMVGKEKLDKINEAGLAKRGDQDERPTAGPDGAMQYSLGSFIGGLATGYTTGQRIKSDKEEREYRREEMKDRREEREYQRKQRAEREQLGTDFGTGMEQAQTQAAQSGGTMYKAGEMVFDNKEDQQAALGILAKEDARIKQQPGFGVNPDAAKFLEQQPELAELRKPKMDADYLFYTTMWPKLKARYAKEYGVDKAMEMDGRLMESADKNHRKRMMEAAALQVAGDKEGALQKYSEIWNRDLPNGTFSQVAMRTDGNVDMTVFDMTGQVIDKKVVPYPDAISMAQSVIGTEGERIRALVEKKREADKKAETDQKEKMEKTLYTGIADLGPNASDKDLMNLAGRLQMNPLAVKKAYNDAFKDDRDRAWKEKEHKEKMRVEREKIGVMRANAEKGEKGADKFVDLSSDDIKSSFSKRREVVKRDSMGNARVEYESDVDAAELDRFRKWAKANNYRNMNEALRDWGAAGRPSANDARRAPMRASGDNRRPLSDIFR